MKVAREPIPTADESLRYLHLKLPVFRGELHRHGHFELTWIQRGEGLRWVGDSVAPFFDGDLVLVGSEIPHLWASRGPEPAEPCTATVLQFPPDWTRRFGLPELKTVAPLMAHAAAGLEVLGETRTAVQRLLAGLEGASALQRVAVLLEVLDRLQAGAEDLRPLSGTLSAASIENASTSVGLPRIDRVLRWIETNLGNDLRVDDAAAIAHVTPAAFGRFFKREVGKNFTAYVNDARCGWAALRLVQSTEPIAQIAQTCGFPTLSNFSDQFRRRYAVAPREFRVGRTLAQRTDTVHPLPKTE
jgi:AraC-like DNA-binding protein